MLHAGLDLSRKRLDVCLLSDQGELIDELAAVSGRENVAVHAVVPANAIYRTITQLKALELGLTATVTPAIVDEIGGIAYVSWTILLYQIGAIVSGMPISDRVRATKLCLAHGEMTSSGRRGP